MNIRDQLGVSCVGWPIINYKNISEVGEHFINVNRIMSCIEIPYIPYDWIPQFQQLVKENAITIYSMHLPKRMISESKYIQQCLFYTIQRAVSMFHIKCLIIHPWDNIVEDNVISEFMNKLLRININISIELTNTKFLQQLDTYLINDKIGLTIDFSHYVRLFGKNMYELNHLPISHIHLRGYLCDKRYARISESLDAIESFLSMVLKKGYLGKVILEYPYGTYESVKEDIKIMDLLFGESDEILF